MGGIQLRGRSPAGSGNGDPALPGPLRSVPLRRPKARLSPAALLGPSQNSWHPVFSGPARLSSAVPPSESLPALAAPQLLGAQSWGACRELGAGLLSRLCLFLKDQQHLAQGPNLWESPVEVAFVGEKRLVARPAVEAEPEAGRGTVRCCRADWVRPREARHSL